MFEVDHSIPWTEHYVRYGFAHLPGLVSKDWCRAAVEEIRAIVGDDHPLTEWTSDSPGVKYLILYWGEHQVLDGVYDQPGVTAALQELFGDRGIRLPDPTERYYALWVNPWDPAARPRYNPLGHLDSGDPWRGVAYYVALSATQTFGGNTTVFPGTQLAAHRQALLDPDTATVGRTGPDSAGRPERWEFVAQAGDVVVVNHLCYHSANPNAAPDRAPRIALRVEVFAEHPLTDLDPQRIDASPWERGYPVEEYTTLPDLSDHVAAG